MPESLEILTFDFALFFTAFLLAFVIVIALIPLIVEFAIRKSLLDQPGGRKQHEKAVPRLGGIAIFFGILIAYFSCEVESISSEVRMVLPGIMMIAFTGLWDDLSELNYKMKLLLQTIAASIILYFGLHVELFVTSSPLLNGIEYLVSFGILIFMTNAFNLIDGVDGLAALLGITSLLGIACILLFQGNQDLPLLLFAGVGAYGAFLLYNKAPASIFMGDLGSLLLGFLLSLGIITILSIPLTANHVFSPLVPLSMIAIPALDAVRVMFLRIRKGDSPFKADRTHVHHILVGNGFRANKTTGLIFFFHLYLIALSLLGNSFSIYVMTPIMLVGFGAGIILFVGLGGFQISRQQALVRENLTATQSENPFSAI